METKTQKVETNMRDGRTTMAFKFVRPLLAMTIVALTFLFAFMLLYKAIPEVNVSSVNLIVGYMLGIATTVVAYYFGTSKDKSDAEQQQRIPNTVTETKTLVKQEEPIKTE